jgi:MFS family permease
VLYVVAVALVISLKLPHQAAPLQQMAGAHPEANALGQATGAGRPRFLSSAPDVFRNLGEGFRYVRGHETIRATILITLLMNLFFYPYMQMGPVIARDVLGVGPGLMGILMSAPGIGAIFGAVAIASASGFRHQGRVYIAGTMLAMTGLLLFSFSTRYAIAFPLMLMLGLGAAGFGTMQGTIVMLVARKEMRGRALGVISLAIGSLPLGMLMTGTVASATSPSFAVGLNAAVGLGLVVMVCSLTPSLMRRIVSWEKAEPFTIEPLSRDTVTD